MRNNTDCYKTRWTSVAVAFTVCSGFISTCADLRSHPSGQAAPQGQRSEPAATAQIQLNLEEDMWTTNDTSMLRKKLEDTFKIRTENHAYRIGMERRSDLREDERIEKAVFMKAERPIQLEVVAKVIEVVEDAGAKPVLLPIYNEGTSVKDCTTCAIWDRRMGWMKPNPLILLVRLRRPNSPVPRDASGLPSIGDLLVSDGIPIVLGSSASSESVAMFTITRDGKYMMGEKLIEKAALEKEISDRIKAQPSVEKVIAIKCSRITTFGSLEDIYHAAYAAGAKRILLDTTVPT